MNRFIIIISLYFLGNIAVTAQLDFTMVDLKNDKKVHFTELGNIYGIDVNKPLIIITWSGNWCFPCIRLIERYNQCDPELFNLITVNVDKSENLEEVLRKGYHKKWNNAINFHADLDKDSKGFDNIFNVSSAPLVLIFDQGRLLTAMVNYNVNPYYLYKQGLIDDIRFIWNSWSDLNSLAWDYYLNEKEVSKWEEAITWVKRSIEINANYNNTDTYAALLYSTGNYVQALKVAKQAIEMAKEEEEDYESTNELIQKIIEKL